MFNSAHLLAHKQGIKETMEQNLIWDKYHGTMKHKSSIYTEIKTISILFDEEPEEALAKMKIITSMLDKGLKVEQHEISEVSYCTKYLRGVRYAYTTKVLRDKISVRQVEVHMRNLILAKLNTDATNAIRNVDCKVMALFKADKIDWQTAVESHEGDCEV